MNCALIILALIAMAWSLALSAIICLTRIVLACLCAITDISNALDEIATSGKE